MGKKKIVAEGPLCFPSDSQLHGQTHPLQSEKSGIFRQDKRCQGRFGRDDVVAERLGEGVAETCRAHGGAGRGSPGPARGVCLLPKCRPSRVSVTLPSETRTPSAGTFRPVRRAKRPFLQPRIRALTRSRADVARK